MVDQQNRILVRVRHQSIQKRESVNPVTSQVHQCWTILHKTQVTLIYSIFEILPYIWPLQYCKG